MSSTATAESLLKTPLNAEHRALGARLVDFAGWEMPVQYQSGIIVEHNAVRNACGVFDLSHMGRVFFRGPDSLALAQRCVTRDLTRVPAGEAAYALLCREDGGILDDIIVYVLKPDELLLVVNASNREKDVAWFQQQASDTRLDVSVDDRTLGTALVGVQGPRAQQVLQPLVPADLEPMPGYSFVETEVQGQPALVARTGYTGEDGFEVMVEAGDARPLWQTLLGAGSTAIACGLGARDTLRTEAGMALYGHEIDESTNPYEARLGWVVSLAKSDFVGRGALERIKASTPSRRLVGLTVAEGGVPRPGFTVRSEGAAVGTLTSGTFSPTLRRNIAIAYVSAPLAGVGQALAVTMRGRDLPAEVVSLPFVPHRTRPRARRT